MAHAASACFQTRPASARKESFRVALRPISASFGCPEDTVEQLVDKCYASAQGRVARALERKQEDIRQQQEAVRREVPEESGVAVLELDFLSSQAADLKRQQHGSKRLPGPALSEVDVLKAQVAKLTKQLEGALREKCRDPELTHHLEDSRSPELQRQLEERAEELRQCGELRIAAERRVLELTREVEQLRSSLGASRDVAAVSVLQATMAATGFGGDEYGELARAESSAVRQELDAARKEVVELREALAENESKLVSTVSLLASRDEQLQGITAQLDASRRKVREMNEELAKVGAYLLRVPRKSARGPVGRANSGTVSNGNGAAGVNTAAKGEARCAEGDGLLPTIPSAASAVRA